jgi:hypothetical protein
VPHEDTPERIVSALVRFFALSESPAGADAWSKSPPLPTDTELMWAYPPADPARLARWHRRLAPILQLVYRFPVGGLERARGNLARLGLSKNSSWLDAAAFEILLDRPIRFFMPDRYYHLPGLHAFARALGAIPVPDAALLSSARPRRGRLSRALYAAVTWFFPVRYMLWETGASADYARIAQQAADAAAAKGETVLR